MLDANCTITRFARRTGVRGDGAPAFNDAALPVPAPALLARPAHRHLAAATAMGVRVELTLQIQRDALRGCGVLTDGEPRVGDRALVRIDRPGAAPTRHEITAVMDALDSPTGVDVVEFLLVPAADGAIGGDA